MIEVEVVTVCLILLLFLVVAGSATVISGMNRDWKRLKDRIQSLEEKESARERAFTRLQQQLIDVLNLIPIRVEIDGQDDNSEVEGAGRERVIRFVEKDNGGTED